MVLRFFPFLMSKFKFIHHYMVHEGGILKRHWCIVVLWFGSLVNPSPSRVAI